MMTDCGSAARQSRVRLGYLDGEHFYQEANGTILHFGDLCSAKFSVPLTQAQELMIWVHRVTREGQSEHLPALVKVSSGKAIREFHVDGARQQFVLPLRDGVKQERKGGAGEPGQLEVEVQLVANRGEAGQSGRPAQQGQG